MSMRLTLAGYNDEHAAYRLNSCPTCIPMALLCLQVSRETLVMKGENERCRLAVRNMDSQESAGTFQSYLQINTLSL